MFIFAAYFVYKTDYINDDVEALKGDGKALKVEEEALKGDR